MRGMPRPIAVGEFWVCMLVFTASVYARTTEELWEDPPVPHASATISTDTRTTA